MAGFQEQATKKNQAKIMSPFTMALKVTWHPCAIVTCHTKWEGTQVPPLHEKIVIISLQHEPMGWDSLWPSCGYNLPHCLSPALDLSLLCCHWSSQSVSPGLSLQGPFVCASCGCIHVSWKMRIILLLLIPNWSTQGSHKSTSKPTPAPFLPHPHQAVKSGTWGL